MKRLINMRPGLKVFAFLVLVLFIFNSCEDDFTTIGGDFINNLELPEPYVVQNLAAYNDNILSVQSNTLNNYLLGKFEDPIFGSSDVSILSQFELEKTNPDFGQDPVLDSVVLTFPLFSTLIDADTYRLDSVFGNGGFKISVFESNQFLSEIEPGENGDFENRQLFYTDQFSEFENNIQDIPLAVSENIIPSTLTETQILFEQIDSTNVDTLEVSPRIRIKLPNDFFQEKILSSQNSINLVSQSSFKNFFRGLYIKAEQYTGEGAMVSLNLNNQDTKITLFYRSLRQQPSLETNNSNEFVETFNTFDLNFRGSIMNFYDNSNTIDLGPQDTINGEENLYVKGGQGIVTVVDPFNGPDNDGNGIADEIDQIRQKNWLINEANLIFYVNEQLAQQLDTKPQRVFAFDLDRNRVLIDYSLDPSATANPLTSISNHLGPLREDEDGNSFYKIRITNHINNIINNDSINTKIGLVITQDVNQANILQIRESQLNQAETFIESAISTPRGQVFHGNLSPDEEKRLKLQIFFTEPN